MITMSMGLFTAMIVIFFLGGGAVGWLLRGLRKDECACGWVDRTDLQKAVRDAIRKDLSCD